jgi:hypothetical protein
MGSVVVRNPASPERGTPPLEPALLSLVLTLRDNVPSLFGRAFHDDWTASRASDVLAS